MRIDDAGRASLVRGAPGTMLRAGGVVLLAALVGCAGGAAPRPEATSTQPASTAAPSSTSVAAEESAPEETSAEETSAEETSAEETRAEEPAPDQTNAEDPAPGPSGEPSPIYFTRVSFDLRALPHRGPRDVDARLVSGRVELLAQRVRDTAGEPPPRLLLYPGASVFRAEFFGTEPAALSQCQRAVDAVLALHDVRATPCARVEP